MPDASVKTSAQIEELVAQWNALQSPALPAALGAIRNLAASLETTSPREIAVLIQALPEHRREGLTAFLQLCRKCSEGATGILEELQCLVSSQQWKQPLSATAPQALDVSSPWPHREARPIAASSIAVVAKLTDLEAEALRGKVTLTQACVALVAQGKIADELWGDHNRQAEIRHRFAQVFDDHRFCRIDALTPEFLRGRELVVALGGDGTMAAVSHLVAGQKAVTGVNIDPQTSRGAILQYSNPEAFLNSLDDLARGSFVYEPWARLETTRNGHPIQMATCEIYFGSSSPYRMSWIKHAAQNTAGESSETITTSSSGLIIGLGASRFVTTAGRYIFPKGIHFPINAPYAHFVFREIDGSDIERSDGASGISDPLKAAWGTLLPGQTLSVTSLTRGPSLFAVDSQLEYDFSNGTSVRVSLSPHPLWTVRPL